MPLILSIDVPSPKRGMKGKDEKADVPCSRPGTLYVVSTPIGNLKDITIRALEVLRGVDLIAAESTTHSKGLCQHYGIRTGLTSYNQHNRRVKGPELMRKLKDGLDIAFITNAGTPCVSDPGSSLIHEALKEGIRVSPVPGPSAVTAALSVSGLPGERFLFAGFLSIRPNKRKRELEDLARVPWTTIFFEAPHRARAMLQDLKAAFGDRMMVMVREQTKMYEEILRGTISSIIERLAREEIRGEFTLVVEGKGKEDTRFSIDDEMRKTIEGLLEKETSIRDIAKKIARERKWPYRTLYKACLAVKREMTVS